jgi:hypothetical protein
LYINVPIHVYGAAEYNFSGKEVNMSSSIRFQGAGHWTSPEYKHFFRTPRGTFLTNQVTSYTCHQTCHIYTYRGPEEVLYLFEAIENPRWLHRPVIGCDIFNFSRTACKAASINTSSGPLEEHF